MKGWTYQSLSQLAIYVNGYAFKPSDLGEEGLPVVRIEQLKNPINAKYDYYKGNLSSNNIIENGDLIFSWSASLFLDIWKHGKAALNQHLFKVIPKENVYKLFLKYLIEYNLEKLTQNAHGSTMQHITRKELDTFIALFPISKNEQKQIAEVLSKIDQSIDHTKNLIAKYNRIKVGLMHDLLTKGIDEQGNIRSEEAHEFKDSPLGRIPTEYFCENFGEYANFKNGLNYNSEQVGEGLKIIGVSNFKSHMTIGYQGLDELRGFERINPEYLLNNNDLLFVRSNGNKELIGRVLLIEKIKEPISFSGFTIRARIVNSAINARYIAYLFNTSLIRKQLVQFGGGTNISNLSQEILSKIKILIPPTEEQKKIVNALDKINQKIDQQKALLHKFQNLKAGLMQDLLTGKVRVTDLILEDVEI